MTFVLQCLLQDQPGTDRPTGLNRAPPSPATPGEQLSDLAAKLSLRASPCGRASIAWCSQDKAEAARNVNSLPRARF